MFAPQAEPPVGVILTLVTEPTNEEMAVYAKVKEYLEDQLAKRAYGYLKRGDSLFGNGELPVRVGLPGVLDFPWDKYMDGYYWAAHQCVETIGSEFTEEYKAYPILFLYRHYLELMLKSLLMTACNAFKCDIPPDASDHNLLKLWAMLETVVEKHRMRPILKGTGDIRRVLAQVTQIDPSSMEMRYGLKKDFETPSMNESKRMSLRNIQTVMRKMYNELNQLMSNFQFTDEVWFTEHGPDDEP